MYNCATVSSRLYLCIVLNIASLKTLSSNNKEVIKRLKQINVKLVRRWLTVKTKRCLLMSVVISSAAAAGTGQLTNLL